MYLDCSKPWLMSSMPPCLSPNNQSHYHTNVNVISEFRKLISLQILVTNQYSFIAYVIFLMVSLLDYWAHWLSIGYILKL